MKDMGYRIIEEDVPSSSSDKMPWEKDVRPPPRDEASAEATPAGPFAVFASGLSPDNPANREFVHRTFETVLDALLALRNTSSSVTTGFLYSVAVRNDVEFGKSWMGQKPHTWHMTVATLDDGTGLTSLERLSVRTADEHIGYIDPEWRRICK